MKIVSGKFAWMSLSLLITLVSGSPVVADDTELLLVTPSTNTNPFNANIMLIIDSSGSMGGIENVNKPYDGTVIYLGSCDPTRMYWTRVGIVPNCTAGNTSWIDESAFACKTAKRQIDGIGLYPGVMVQYRADSSSTTAWRTLEQGYNTEIIECDEDSGFDGAAGFAGSLVYAQAGTDLLAFTDDPNLELAWGSFPASESYTIFSGNYINWRENPTTVDLTRLDIVKTSAKIAMSSINSSNIGIMRFNNGDGGPVIQGLTDLDSNRVALDAVVDAITAGGSTPLSETLYEAALYWMGLPAHYGELISEHPTDPGALLSTAPEVYAAPSSPVCTKNYNVLLTDGIPVSDLDTPALAPTLPDFATKLGRSTCTGTNEGDCLDDIAEYLSIPDLSVPQKGDQTVVTHTIGFTINLPILQDAADASGGEYYLADDIENLTLALLQIFKQANKQELAFTSPAVAVNGFNRTQNLNDLYMTVFRSAANYSWPGNLKKYRLIDGVITDKYGASAVDPLTGFFDESTTSFWTAGAPDGKEVELGGAANVFPAPASRKVYTNNGNADLTAATNAVSTANISAFTLSDFGLTGSAAEPTLDEIINWARGEDVMDLDANPATTERRQMGDPLHAQPAAIFYGGSPGNEDVVIYSATNDGYLHAIDSITGVELWSFIPKDLLSRFAALMVNPSTSFKSYALDGDVIPVVIDRDKNGIIDGTDIAYILFGMRRGGNQYFALDVTDKNVPKLLWQKSFTAAGQSWSAPVIARVDIDDPALNADDAVVIIGGGYDPVHDTPTFPTTADNAGAGILMLDLVTGNEIWRASRAITSDLVLPDMTRSIPNRIRVIDIDGDRMADRMYAADVGGQIWRFDIFNGNIPSNLVTGGVVAQIGAEGIATPSVADTRRVYNTPDVALLIDNNLNRRFLSVNVGTGYRAHPLNDSATDAFYSFRDPDVFRALTQLDYDNYDVAVDADFVEVAGSTNAVLGNLSRGWKFTLPADQMILSNSAVFNDELFFVAFAPDAVAAADCTVRVGSNFLYRVTLLNGDPLGDLANVVPGTEDQLRVQQLAQGGIAPSPRFLFPSPEPGCVGDACSPLPIYCVGTYCDSTDYRNNPVRTLWTQDGIE